MSGVVLAPLTDKDVSRLLDWFVFLAGSGVPLGNEDDELAAKLRDFETDLACSASRTCAV